MNLVFTFSPRALRRMFTALGFLAAMPSGYAQQPVTAVYTHTINATTSTAYTGTGATGNISSGLTGNTYTYHFGTNVAASDNMQVLDSFIALGFTYRYQPLGMSVKFQRVNNANVTGLRKSMWFDQDGGTVNAGGTAALYAEYDDSLERVFTERLFDAGIDNVFQNAVTTNKNKIERMDVIFSSALYSTDNTKAGFAVFDRGTAGSHDPFYVAAVQTVDANGNPLTYYNAVLVASTDYGSSVGGNVTYLILRKNPADANLLLMDNSTSQNRDGVFLRFSDLGVPSNAKILGYSLMGTDVVVTPSSNMANYTNAAIFPTNSDYGTLGGLDPLAVTGLWTTNSSLIILSDWFNTFSASWSIDKVCLNWGLGVTENGKELILERSADGNTYAPLISYPYPGTATQSAVDEHPLPGKNYYRLSLLNNEGAVTAYSTVSMVEAPSTGLITLNIYPDPVQNGQLSIDVRGLSDQACELRLFDLNGNPLAKYELSGGPISQRTISLPRNLAKGLYIIQLLDKKGNKILVKKMAVE